eukprot:1454307-Rhodomonas_salina.1
MLLYPHAPAMPGTDLEYAAICLGRCYAMPGTDLAHAAIFLRCCYAMSGTDLAYGPTSKPRLGRS